MYVDNISGSHSTVKILTMIPQEDFKNTFGSNLGRLILRKHKSYRQFAMALGMDASQLSRIIKGKQFASEGTIERFCKQLDAEPWEFFISATTPIIQDEEEADIITQYRKAKELGISSDFRRHMRILIKDAETTQKELQPEPVEGFNEAMRIVKERKSSNGKSDKISDRKKAGHN
jgi:transcriptional regulator with XRE-family HTH domain